MPSMPTYYLAKGSQFRLLDEQFGGEPAAYMAAYEAALTNLDEPLSDVARRHSDPASDLRAGLTAADVDHFRAHWLGRGVPDDAWWEPGARVEDLLRAGFREAIKRARDLGLPIETLWVCADEETFQVYICQGPRQVTVIVFTPKVPQPAHVPTETLTEDEPIWVVKVRDEHDRAYSEEEQVVSADGEIIVKRLRYAPNAPAVRTA